MELEYIATCLFGLEKTLGEEIDVLGYKRTFTMDGRVGFLGDLSAAARANIFLRTAEHVFVRLSRFAAGTFSELHDGVRAIPWEEYLGKEDAFPVKGHSIKSRLFSVPDCQSIIKKAIVNRLSSVYGVSWFEETGNRYQVEFFLFKDEVSIMIDTTGIPLHKRGYRPEAGAAPLRETLASSLCAFAHIRPDCLLWDPFCGSGTIAIEAAMRMEDRAPGLGRSFAGETIPWLDPASWEKGREEARDRIKQDADFEIYASDIDPEVLSLAKENARRAGVDRRIRFFVADARKIQKENRRGTVICNPPYGERLMDQKSVAELYRDIGRPFRALYPWQVYILTSCDTFEQLYGCRADKVRKLYNGMIPSYFYEFFKPHDKKT